MTPYTKLKMHLDRYMYTRGQFKGEAPADQSKRYKNHFRVGKQGDTMCVTMYRTNLIEVTPDNNVRINMGGWWTSTTKANINEALHYFLGWGSIYTVMHQGHRQLAIRANRKTYRYYDGMTFDSEGNPTCELKAFSASRTDRDATKEFREDMKESGFKDVWPVLFASAEPNKWWGVSHLSLRKFVTHELHANQWPEIAAYYKYYFDDHKKALAAISAKCTCDLKEVVDTDVTVI